METEYHMSLSIQLSNYWPCNTTYCHMETRDPHDWKCVTSLSNSPDNSHCNLMFFWPCIMIYTLYQLPTYCTNSFIHIMLQSSTCFEQYYAHPQEVRLYVYSMWYRHCLWRAVVVVQYTGWERGLSQPVYCTTTMTTNRQWQYHILYTYNLTSWGWA